MKNHVMNTNSLHHVSIVVIPLFALATSPVVLAHGSMESDHMFQMMDSNGDGKISAEEHAAAAKKMFEKMDSDKDGKVTAAEMDTAHEEMAGKMGGKGGGKMGGKGGGKMGGMMHMSSADKIKVVDSNNDGVLSAEEQAAGAKMMFEKMDADKDGYLTKAELEAGHKNLMSKPERK